MTDPDAVLITDDLAKLPPEVSALLDPAVPLPMGVTHFEKRFDGADLLLTGLLAAGLAVAGLLTVVVGVVIFYDKDSRGVVTLHFMPIGIGLVLLFAAVWMAVSLRTRWALRAEQKAGRATRRGIFLIGDRLVDHGTFGVTVIARSAFRGVAGATVSYAHDDQAKTFKLPATLTNATPEQMQAAVARWGGPTRSGGLNRT